MSEPLTDTATRYGYWLGRIEAATGVRGDVDPAVTLDRVERLVALERAVVLNRQEAAALAVWGAATREDYRSAAVLWDRRVTDALSNPGTAVEAFARWTGQ